MRLLNLFSLPSAKRASLKRPGALVILALCGTLSGCFAPLLAMGPSQLMWAFIKPFVGLDPSSSQLFEKPLIKNRMTELLGEDYESTLALLRTAPALKQEGTLFYLASPTEDGQAQAAGLVWNAQTNKMSALVNNGKETKLFTEPDSTVPVVWPKTLQSLVAPANTSALKASFSGQAVSGQDAAAAELTDTEQQLKAAQAQLKSLQDKAQLEAVQAQIKALEKQANSAAKAKLKSDAKAAEKATPVAIPTKVVIENKSGLSVETSTDTKKVKAAP